MEDENYLTLKKYALKQGKNERTIRNYIKQGRLKAGKRGRMYYIRKDAKIRPVEIERDYNTVEEVAEELGISPRSVRSGISQGYFPATKVNRKYRIPKAYVEQIEEEAYQNLKRQDSS